MPSDKANTKTLDHIARRAPLSHRELYLFDTMGFLRIPQFITAASVDRCRSEIDRLAQRDGEEQTSRVDGLAHKSPHINDLARSDAVRACLQPLINQPLRLIESYALRRQRGGEHYLHNGQSEFASYGQNEHVQRNMSNSHTFHEGKLFCMFVKVLIFLSPIGRAEDGPFCYLEGSHKANWPWFTLSEDSGPRPVLTVENFPSLRDVYAQPGDALLLNEALMHGTLPKASDGVRVVMALSYAPAFVTDWKQIDRRSTDIDMLGHM